MKEIKLRSGEVTVVDDCMFKIASAGTWYAIRRGHQIHAYRKGENGKTVYLHRLIIGAKAGEIVDHINRNGLDNRLENLRLVNKAQNANNSVSNGNTSGYRGVSLKNDGRKKKFRAVIVFEEKQIFLGNYYTSIEAAKAYDEAALKYYGKETYFNFRG